MSCSRPPTARCRRAVGGELERLADLGGEQGDAAGVLLGRDVAALEADHQRAHARAEVGLLGGDQLGGGEVADQRARGAGALDVERGRDADERTAGDLEQMAEVEAERIAPRTRFA